MCAICGTASEDILSFLSVSCVNYEPISLLRKFPSCSSPTVEQFGLRSGRESQLPCLLSPCLYNCIDYRTRGDDTKGTQIQLVEPCLIVITAIVEYSAF